jgi:hypothetical protein
LRSVRVRKCSGPGGAIISGLIMPLPLVLIVMPVLFYLQKSWNKKTP